jgi:undecaprenyl-diphosphatase
VISIGYAILLGIIQGLTEFLPISSTAHLTLTGALLHLIDPQRPEDWTAYIAIMQLGTVAAVILYFFRDLLRMTGSFVADLRNRAAGTSAGWSHNSRTIGTIILGTLPVAVIGLAFKKIIEGTFTKEITTIATSLIAVALILLLAEIVGKRKRTEEQITWRDGLVIGFAQACALIPGSSRSGSTITAGLFLGLTRQAAARFSFLLSIPAVVASGFFEMYEVRHHIGDLGLLPLMISTVVAGIVGYATIAFLLGYLKTHSTKLFVLYRVLLGLLLWGLVLTHTL